LVIAAIRESVHTQLVTRTVLFAGYPDVQLLDLVGPAEAFALVNRFVPDAYRVEVASMGRRAVTSSSGLELAATRDLGAFRGAIDTLVVPGGIGTLDAMSDRSYLAAVARAARRARRLTSVCSGAYLLAEAGLLDGRRATTHWSECDRFARRYPRVQVEADAIYVRDDDVWTSAGITAGIDLALALIEADHGREVSLTVARWLVVFVRRPGGQSQFSTQLAAQLAERDALRDLQHHIAEHPDDDLSVGALARRVHMSERHFARTFAHEVGTTPASYVERARTEIARRLLQETGLGLDAVADAAGFGSVETLRRMIHKHLGVAPSDYRSRFRTSA
jgi:transcriptional regulator GlxA family with amidase domain